MNDWFANGGMTNDELARRKGVPSPVHNAPKTTTVKPPKDPSVTSVGRSTRLAVPHFTNKGGTMVTDYAGAQRLDKAMKGAVAAHAHDARSGRGNLGHSHRGGADAHTHIGFKTRVMPDIEKAGLDNMEGRRAKPFGKAAGYAGGKDGPGIRGGSVNAVGGSSSEHRTQRVNPDAVGQGGAPAPERIQPRSAGVSSGRAIKGMDSWGESGGARVVRRFDPTTDEER